jgi:hypothetical protein
LLPGLLTWIERDYGLFADTDSFSPRPVLSLFALTESPRLWPRIHFIARLFRTFIATISRTQKPASRQE